VRLAERSCTHVVLHEALGERVELSVGEVVLGEGGLRLLDKLLDADTMLPAAARLLLCRVGRLAVRALGRVRSLEHPIREARLAALLAVTNLPHVIAPEGAHILPRAAPHCRLQMLFECVLDGSQGWVSSEEYKRGGLCGGGKCAGRASTLSLSGGQVSRLVALLALFL
jgi:hypothetical protein